MKEDLDGKQSFVGLRIYANMKICILIPAYDEAATIRETIDDYRRVFPSAVFVVIDNNSTDATSEVARGALNLKRDYLLSEEKQGKGSAVKAGLSRVSADVYIMTDGDNTYPADDAAQLVDTLVKSRCDMAVGDRFSGGSYAAQNDRLGHSIGNRFLTWYISVLAGQRYCDVLSGLRIMSRPFVSMLGIQSTGFQLEAELNIVAAYTGAKVIECPTAYLKRPEGSQSKLSTWGDGLRIMWFAFINWIAFYPLQAFGLLAIVAFTVSGLLGVRVMAVFLETGLMPYPSSAVAAATAGLVGLQSLFSGLILYVNGQTQRRRDVAHFLEARRHWNAMIDKCSGGNEFPGR
jgi:hypothetical protein